MKKHTLILILSFALFILPTFTFASSNGLVIDEFRTRGTTAYDEYIVLANYGFDSINLENYTLYKKTSSGTTNYLLFKFPNYVLNPRVKVTIVGKDYAGTRHFSYSTSNSLADTNNAIIIADANTKIIDSVTYGSVNFDQKEGVPLANPESGIAYKRIDGKDTDNNSADFSLQKVTAVYNQLANKMILTELMPDPKNGDEWFEIYNPLSVAVNLTGLTACDRIGATHCYSFSETIGPFGYKVFEESKTKITFNNDGDILQIKDPSGLVISSSQNSYGKTTKDCAYGLFGKSWQWTKSPTKGASNILSVLTTLSSIKNSSKTKTDKNITSKEPDTSSGLTTNANDSVQKSTEVKGDETKSEKKISKREVGYALIVLAVFTVIGYTIYENREKIYDIYYKIIRRNNKIG